MYKRQAYVGADNYEIGKAVGEYVANVLHGQGDVVEISGLVGSTPAVDRHQGFVKAISCLLYTSGARNEAMAFTNCPKVSELASRSPLTMLESSGLSLSLIHICRGRAVL